jgi:hypothetical protein
MVTGGRAAIVSILTLGILHAAPSTADAKQCPMSCKRAVSKCVAEECAELLGQARTNCARTCGAKLGCGGPRFGTLAHLTTSNRELRHRVPT